MFKNRTHLTTMQVCYLLGISPTTLRNWYKYVNTCQPLPEDCPGLPPYQQENERAPKYWNMVDMHQLYAFQHWIPKGRKGVMGEISQAYWSEKFYKKQK